MLILLCFGTCYSQSGKNYINPTAVDSAVYVPSYLKKGDYLNYTGKLEAMEVYESARTWKPEKKVFGSDTLYLRYEMELDNKARVIRYCDHNLEGAPYDFFYDKQGRLAVLYRYQGNKFDVGMPVINAHHYTYDATGNLMSDYFYLAGNEVRFLNYCKYSYIYTKNAFVVNEIVLNRSKPAERTHDDPIYYKRQAAFTALGILYDKVRTFYSTEPNKQAKENYINRWLEYTYATNNNGQQQVTEVNHLFEDGTITCISKYNANGTLALYTKKVTGKNIDNIATKIYTYNPRHTANKHYGQK